MEPVDLVLKSLLRKARVKQYPQGQIILYEGDSPHEVYVVKSGYIKVYDIDEAGNEKILSIVKPGDIMPYSFFSGSETTNKWYYQSIGDADVHVLNRDKLLKAMLADSELALSLINRFSREVHELLTRLSSMSKSRTETRLIALMRYFVVCLGGEAKNGWWRVPFPINQQFLADITGMTRESCTSAMKALTDNSITRSPKLNVLEVNTKKLNSDD